MNLRKLITASLLAASSTAAFGGAADFTDIMSYSAPDSRMATACMARLDGQNSAGSRFQSNLLPSATAVKMNVQPCVVDGIRYSASNSQNLFSQQPKATVAIAEFARFSLIDDSNLLSNKTVLQAAVTR